MIKKMLFKISFWFGKVYGKYSHRIKGCKPFFTYIKNRRGKFYQRRCKKCGKLQNKVNGKWKTI